MKRRIHIPAILVTGLLTAVITADAVPTLTLAYYFSLNYTGPSNFASFIDHGTPFLAPDAAHQGIEMADYYADGFVNNPLGHAFEFRMMVKPGKSFRLYSLNFEYKIPPGGPTQYDIYYSNDGLTWTSMLPSGPAGLIQGGNWYTTSVTLPVLSSPMDKAVYFAIYGLGATDASARFWIDTVQVYGYEGAGILQPIFTGTVALRHQSGLTGFWRMLTALNIVWSPVNLPGPDWRIRGMYSNRVLLQNGDGGTIGFWNFNNTPVTWTQVSGPLPGWVARDMYDKYILLQNGAGGAVGLWELAPGGQVTQWIPLSGPVPGWTARALWSDRVLLQQGDGGAAGLWHFNSAFSIWKWTLVTGAMPGWVLRDMTGDRILLQQGEGGVSGYWMIGDGLPYTWWRQLSPALPGWTIGTMQNGVLH